MIIQQTSSAGFCFVSLKVWDKDLLRPLGLHPLLKEGLSLEHVREAFLAMVREREEMAALEGRSG
jgi:hypothetical protein